jgi:ribosomal protein S12 methylthiotransferase accessory factor YcaO
MITHLNKLTPVRFDMTHLATQNERIRDVVAACARHNLTVHAWSLPTDMPVPVILGAIVDESGVGARITFGARATFDVAEAVINALTEALSLRIGIRSSFRDTPITPPLTKKSRVAYWAQKENLDDLAHLFASPLVQHTLEAPPPRDTWLDILKDALRAAAMEVYYADLTTDALREIPLYTVNVLISEMQPLNLEERIPYDSGTRLTEVPKKLGYKPAPQPNPLPHPFS